MNRPFAVIGFTYLISLMLLSFLGICIPLTFSVALILLFIALTCVKKIRDAKVIPVAIIFCLLAVNVFSLKFSDFLSKTQNLNDVDISISGTICDVPYKAHGKFYYLVDVKTLNDQNVNGKMKIRLSSSETLSAETLDKISCQAHTFLPNKEGLISQRSYLLSKGIYLSGYISSSESVLVCRENVFSLSKLFLYMQVKIKDSISNLLPRELSSIATGMLLGDKHIVDDTVKSNFRDLGVSHLLAVSGLHTAVIAKMLQMLFSLFGLNRKISALFSCLGIFVFMVLTGFSPSVMRAGIMAIIFFAAEILGGKPDSLNSLGLAVFIILLINPFSAGDVGMLLSFFATLGIILFESTIRQKIPLPKFIASTISVTTSATLLTLPIIMISFGRISILSIISNFLLVTPSMMMIPCILLASAFSFSGVLSFCAAPFAFIAGVIIKYVLLCSKVLSRIPCASIDVSQPYMILWLIFSLIIFAIAFLLKRFKSRTLEVGAMLCVILLLVNVLSDQIANRDKTSLAVLNVGKGCSTVLIKNGHAAILTCGGTKYSFRKVLDFLDRQNIRMVDYMVVPDYSDSSCCYTDDILKGYNVSTLLLKNDNKKEDKITYSLLPDNTTYYFDKSVKTDLWGNVKIEILTDKNKSFIKLHVNDVDTLICPNGGNIKTIPENFCSCDFFVVGKSPNCAGKIKFTYSIISSDEKGTSNIISKIPLCENNSYVTSSQGDIIVDFIRNNVISVKRGI